MKFRHKPQVVDAIKCSEAIQFSASDWRSLPEWLALEYEKGNIVFARDHIFIRSSDKSSIRASTGDWIVNSDGFIFPLSEKLFAESYDPIYQ